MLQPRHKCRGRGCSGREISYDATPVEGRCGFQVTHCCRFGSWNWEDVCCVRPAYPAEPSCQLHTNEYLFTDITNQPIIHTHKVGLFVIAEFPGNRGPGITLQLPDLSVAKVALGCSK